jgi:hypothetical protein
VVLGVVVASMPVPASASALVPHRLVAAAVPGAPLEVSAAPQDGSIEVSWMPPLDDGGEPISGYIATASPAAATCTTTGATTCTITGLNNGAEHSVTVVASNSAGDGPASAPVGPIVPRTTPGAPSDVRGRPLDRAAAVRWAAPATTGGAAVTRYRVLASPGDAQCVTRTRLTCTVDGLVNGHAYRFSVSARNEAGWGVQSPRSDAVVPRRTPSRPLGVAVEPKDRRVAVSWTAPRNDGGVSVERYIVDATPGAGRCETSGRLYCQVTDLRNGVAYRFAVVAVNAAGRSEASRPSRVVVPRTVPSPPRGARAEPADRSVRVRWTAPRTDGGARVRRFEVRAFPGGRTCTTRGRLSCRVRRLENGRPYRFAVRAENVAGWSERSAMTVRVRPRTVPTRPVGVHALPRNAGAKIFWQRPHRNRGARVDAYVAIAFPGGRTCRTARSGRSCVISGLPNDVRHAFVVRARNAAGWSEPSRASNPVVPKPIHEFPILTGNEFKDLTLALQPLPGTVSVAPYPSITGNGDADARIRWFAEARGYRLRSTPTVGLVHAGGVPLTPDTAAAFQRLLAAARARGLPLGATSGYRSIDTQRGIFLRKLGGYTASQIAAGNADGAIGSALRFNSIPGYSKHHTAHAIDLVAGGTLASFENSPTEQWLRADNFFVAKQFGFIPSYPRGATTQGPEPEPWEYIYVGQQAIRCAARYTPVSHPSGRATC